MVVPTVVGDVGSLIRLGPLLVAVVVLSVGGTLGSVAEYLDGVLYTALDVDF